jgi:hypothetical protein
MRSGWLLVGCLLCTSPMVGCTGGSSNDFEQKIDMDFSAVIKSDLEAIAKSGRIGSGYSVLVANVNALKAKDATKGEALQKGLEELIKVQGPDKIKAKAKELIKLL